MVTTTLSSSSQQSSSKDTFQAAVARGEIKNATTGQTITSTPTTSSPTSLTNTSQSSSSSSYFGSGVSRSSGRSSSGSSNQSTTTQVVNENQPMQSRTPQVQDQPIGTKSISGNTYQVYKGADGNTFIGETVPNKSVSTFMQYNNASSGSAPVFNAETQQMQFKNLSTGQQYQPGQMQTVGVGKLSQTNVTYPTDYRLGMIGAATVGNNTKQQTSTSDESSFYAPTAEDNKRISAQLSRQSFINTRNKGFVTASQDLEVEGRKGFKQTVENLGISLIGGTVTAVENVPVVITNMFTRQKYDPFKQEREVAQKSAILLSNMGEYRQAASLNKITPQEPTPENLLNNKDFMRVGAVGMSLGGAAIGVSGFTAAVGSTLLGQAGPRTIINPVVTSGVRSSYRFLTNTKESDLIQTGLNAEGEKASSLGFFSLQGIGYQSALGLASKNIKNAGIESVSGELKQRGYSDTQIQSELQNYKKARTGEAFAEFGGIVSNEAISNIYGGLAFGAAKTAGQKIISVAGQGIGEAVGGETVQREVRGIKPLTTMETVGYGAFGAATAGTFRGLQNWAELPVTAGKGFLNSLGPKVRTVGVEALGYGIDFPGEASGDIATAGLFKGARAFTTTPTNTFNNNPSKNQGGFMDATFTSYPSENNPFSSTFTQTKGGLPATTNPFAMTFSNTNTKTKTLVPGTTNTGVTSFTNTDTTVGTFVDTNVPVPIPVPTKTNTFISNQTDTFVNTNTFTDTFNNTFIFTPDKLVPFFPLGGGTGSDSGSGKKKSKGKKGQKTHSIFQSIVGGRLNYKQPKGGESTGLLLR